MPLFGSIYRYFQVNIVLGLSINPTVSETWSAHEDCRHKLPDELGKTHNQGYVGRAQEMPSPGTWA
ncbi:hypothetical protein TWF706_009394 [Orbilia oligospora]|nr:hypothetical protein TWF706_009394 [Orbilia oligospora]